MIEEVKNIICGYCIADECPDGYFAYHLPCVECQNQAKQTCQLMDAECQAKVERIFKEIESISYRYTSVTFVVARDSYKALKEKEVE